MLPVARFLSFLNEHQLLPQNSRTLLAISGGRDSVLMASLFNEAGLDFGIAHCNFGLRGDESDGDEVFVRQLAAHYQVPFYSVRFDTVACAAQGKVSIQMAARDLRYEWLEQQRKANHYHSIAVAHHASDVTETVLLNLVRGTGIAGLHGILPRRGKVIRPLLFLQREEIAGIVSAQQIVFREDSSNASSKYARNKLRLEVIPRLKELNAGLDETFEKNSRRFGQIEAFMAHQVGMLRAELFFEDKNGTIVIALDRVKHLYPRELLLFELLRPFNFSEAVLSDVLRSLDSEPGKLFFSLSHTLLLDRDKLILEPKEKVYFAPVLWHSTDQTIEVGSEQFSMSIAEVSLVRIEKDTNKAFFDESLLQYPLKLRLLQEGDYFYPFGMKGKKKVSDFLRELKIPLTQKKRIWLLVNGNGDILWVTGYRMDNRYRITPATKKVSTFKRSTS